ncbi:MAG TPA: aminopeptidase N [Arenimonas sp.]|nr:aminopeptidase N [Arenimonas sp.]
MNAPRDDGYIYLDDYTPAPWRITRVELVCELGRNSSEIEARLHLSPGEPWLAPLELDGEELELLAIAIDHAPLPPERYAYDGHRLRIDGLTGPCVLHTRVRIDPSRNTRLEGLYASGELLLTQCEAEGFRRITFFLDRPDVMPVWDIVLRAEQSRFPVLLANGNRVSQRLLDGGRHEAHWHNPHPTPSYLFAIAAGPLAHVGKPLFGADGRHVQLNVWAAPSDIGRCHYALGAIERALRWDETRFGRHYDLDLFNVVAAQDFTMGAMENKGLNIFNARYILADEATATDADFLAIESVVAHEYLHNWSGNRVTCRDWFQLSLKEGLTVFRDQEFSSDLHSRALKRIETVRMLRARQFAEDGGALAHPVRPMRYREINNFYTATVYEKGAEVVRLLHTLLGDDVFRAGMDRYFADNDGRAATIEDFLAAHTAVSGRDLSHFARWYAQAGTPELHITDHYDADSGDYVLEIEQRTPATPDQPDKLPLLIPLRFAFYGNDGRPLFARGEGDAPLRGELLELAQAQHRIVFRGLAEAPLPAFNQGFAAPVQVHYPYTPAQLARLAQVERDPLARWDVLQRLASDSLLGRHDAELCFEGLHAGLAGLLTDDLAEPDFVAECLQLPDFDTLAEQAEPLDIDALLGARDALQQRLASALAEPLLQRYQSLASAARGGLDASAMAARSLRNAALALLCREGRGIDLAARQFANASGMTDRLAALRGLLHAQASQAAAALDSFRQRAGDDPLLTDKWIGLQVTRPQPDALDDVRALLASPWWKPANPNRVRAVLGNFARGNPHAFHRRDGAGYRLLGEQVAVLDGINPQVAARLLSSLENWRRFDAGRQVQVEAVLRELQGGVRSPDCRDLLARLVS